MYFYKKSKIVFSYLISLLVLILIFCFSLLVGTKFFTPKQIFSSFTDFSSVEHTIIFSVRLPRLFLNIISGSLLGASGAVFQLFFRNPLAEPGLMGLSSAATLGAVFSKFVFNFFAFLNGFFSSLNFFAFVSTLLAGIFLSSISSFLKEKSSVVLLLIGIALGNFCSALSSLIILTHSNEFSGIYSWILGSFNARAWNELKFVWLPSLISVFLMIFLSKSLDLLNSGEESAKSLGLNVKKVQILVLISSSLAVSSAVCAGGTINFVGILAPHLIRKFCKKLSSRSIFLITFSMIFGAILVLLCDTFSRTVFAPSELPAGIVISFIGSLFFISLIFNQKGEQK